jgi:hypothetical protein
VPWGKIGPSTHRFPVLNSITVPILHFAAGAASKKHWLTTGAVVSASIHTSDSPTPPPNRKRPPLSPAAASLILGVVNLTLTRFETLLGFVDHINTALAAHYAAIAVTRLQRAERVFNLHRSSPLTRRCVRLGG